MFGGKGKSYNFYATGDELFDVMCQLERELGCQSFFCMDENFLLHRKRALRLLELMEKNDKAWALYVFSSANVLRSYTIDQLVRLGVSWVWMGIEGCNSQYVKLQGIDTFELVRELQSHGIRVLGSTIIGLEEHTPENIDAAIEHAARHDTDFHQFMLYTPIPGTPLHAELTAKGQMKDPATFEQGDIHGQLVFNYRHPHIPAGMEAEFMVRAFDRDFQRNGPSTLRIVRTTLAGWKRYKNHPDARVRRRFAWEARELATTFSAAVAGAKMYYRRNPAMRAKMAALLKELNRGVRLEVAADVAAGRAVRLLEASAGREAAGRRLDLRAADLLREERRLPRRGCRSLPLRHAGDCPAAGEGGRQGASVGERREGRPDRRPVSDARLRRRTLSVDGKQRIDDQRHCATPRWRAAYGPSYSEDGRLPYPPWHICPDNR